MTSVLLCTGKKKKIQAVADYYTRLHTGKKVNVLSMKITTKKALFWNYEELKILFEAMSPGNATAPDRLLNGLDSHVYRKQALVLLNCQSPRVEDEMLKVKILTACHGYVSKGVRAKVTVKEFKESEYRIYYQCTIQFKGPVESVVSCKDELVKESLCDPDTVSYLF